LVPWETFWGEIELGMKEAIKAEVRSSLKRELQAKLNAWRYKFRLVFEEADEDGTGVAQAIHFAVRSSTLFSRSSSITFLYARL
jgi:hypothetical protein